MTSSGHGMGGTEDTLGHRLSLLSSEAGEETLVATGSDEDALYEAGLEAEMPERIGRYLVLDRLGAGAMGVVYSAYDPDLDRKLALKVLHDDDRRSQQTQVRLLREAQALARVSHPNVIHVYDVGTFEDHVYIAMEYVEGLTLGAWLKAEERPLRVILSTFSQAGHGLAAAHAKGLVHRDFKPDNVIVAKDGRAVVLDFGIAHAIHDTEHSVDGDDSVRERIVEHSSAHGIGREGSGTLALDTQLTRAGAMVGTPAYMAPEQYDSSPTDARTDQFSFCVALWEAIHGERPFRGDSPLALWHAVRDGKLRPPSKRRVPRGVQRALTRGLSVDPDRRFESMAPLLAILDRDPRAIRRRLVAAAMGLAIVGLGSWGLWSNRDEEPVCAGADQRIESAWGAKRRAAVERAFAEADLPLARDALPPVLEGLDAYAAQWRGMYTDACEATHLRGEQSEELLDLRMACLEERKLALDSVVEVLLEPDATVIENSYQLVDRLRPIETCADQAVLKARVPPPEDDELAERVEDIRRELARARARRDAGDHERGLSIAREAEARAALIDYAPIQAAALLELGLEQMEAGDYEDSEATLRAAFYRALAAGDEEVAVHAATELVRVTGDRLQHFDAADNWAKIADAILDRRGDQRSHDRVALEHMIGSLSWRRGEFERSREELERALELAESLPEPEPLLVARVRKGLGSTLWSLGKAEAAADQFQIVVDTVSAELGANHPQVGSALNNLASAHYSLGRPDLAELEFMRTLGIYVGSYGNDHPSVANSLNNLAVVYTTQGKLEQARETHERVIGIHERTRGPKHPGLATSWSNLARVLRVLHDYEQAASYHRKAYELRREVLGENHTDTMNSLRGLAQAQVDLGETDEGLRNYEITVETLRRELGDEHRDVAEAEYDFGQSLVQIDRAREGEAHLREALKIREAELGPEHREFAQTLAALAHALVEQGEWGEAAKLLERFEASPAVPDLVARERAAVRFDLARIAVGGGKDELARREAEAGLQLLKSEDDPGSVELRARIEAWLDGGG